MSALILPRRFTNQPQGPVELNPKHWLVERGVSLFVPMGLPYGIFDGELRPISQAPFSVAPSNIGNNTQLVTEFDGSNSLLLPTTKRIIDSNQQQFTISVWFNVVDTTNNHNIFGQGTSGTTNSRVMLQAGGALTGDPIRLVVTNYGTTAQVLAVSTTGYTAGKWHFATATHYALHTGSAYIDGGSKGSHTATATYATLGDTARVGWAPGIPDGIAYDGDKFANLLILPYSLNDAEVRALYIEQRDAPYEMFRTPKHVLYFSTSAGGTNTDSAAGSGSITVTGSAAAALRTHLGVAASGSIALTGSAANGVHTTLTNVTSDADAGSIALTGSAANAVRTFLAAAESGAISITGSTANGIYTPVGAYNADAQSGAISVTGSPAIGRHDYLATAGSGAITVTGSSANAIKSLGAVADSGSIAITGSNALAIRTWLASADSGSIALTGSSANGVKATPGTGTLDPATIAAIADAVWSHSSAVQIEQRLTEAWGRLGLDPANPLISGQTEISFGSIVMALTGNQTSSTLTRQP